MVDREIQSAIDKINGRLTDTRYKLGLVDIGQLKLLDKNARFMKNETYRNLVDNVKKDKALGSAPLCYREGDVYSVLSGNHRVEAARDAGVGELLILYIDSKTEKLQRQDQVAIQISHNSLVGEDDPLILRELWEEIDDISLKYYSGLDDKLMGQMPKVDLDAISEARLDYQVVTFIFFPEEVERLEEMIEKADGLFVKSRIYAAMKADYERFLRGLAKIMKSHDIRNMATAMTLLMDMFDRHQTDLADGWDKDDSKTKKWVPISTIIGTENVPEGAARTIKRAVEKMRDSGEVSAKNLWQALEYMAAEYLGGPISAK